MTINKHRVSHLRLVECFKIIEILLQKNEIEIYTLNGGLHGMWKIFFKRFSLEYCNLAMKEKVIFIF